MVKIGRVTIGFFVFIMLSLWFVSCNRTSEAPPFPAWEMEYQQPITKKITFPEPEPIVWDSTKTIKLGELPTQAFDLDKLPSKPFIIDGITNIEGQITEEPFDLDSLPSIPFNLDSLPSSKIKIDFQPLGDPDIKEVRPLTIPQNASRGVQMADIAFALDGNPKAIITDNDGFLWMVSTQNIARFDSNHFEIYGKDQGLGLNNGFNLFQDSKNRLWVTGRGSIWILDLKNKLVGKISIDFPIEEIFGIIEDSNGNIWCSNITEGFFIFNLETGQVKTITEKEGLISGVLSQYISPFQDSKGLIWLSSFNGIDIIDPNLKTKRTLKFEKPKDSLKNTVLTIKEDSSGKIWIGGFGGAYYLDKEKKLIGDFPNEQGSESALTVPYIFEDDSKNIWLSSAAGFLRRYAPEYGTVEKIKLIDAQNQALRPIEEDYQGNIWATVKFNNGGLYRINLKDGRPGNFNDDDGLINKRVYSTIQREGGKVWIGTVEGINIYDPLTNSIKTFGENQNLKNPNTPYLDPDSKGRIWASGGNNGDGISIIDPVKNTIQHITKEQGLTKRYRPKVEDLNGDMWIGGFDGNVLHYDMANNIIREFQITQNDSFSAINKLKVDLDGYIWGTSTRQGIFKIYPKKQTIQIFKTDHGLLSNVVYYIQSTRDNKIWIGSNNGVQLLDPINSNITSFQKEQGLVNNETYDINIWKNKVYIGTAQGITVLEPIIREGQKDTFFSAYSIGKEQGLKYLDVALGSTSFDQNGRYWAGIEGEILTNIDQIKNDLNPIKTEITGLNIFDEKIDFNSGDFLISNRKSQVRNLTKSDTISSKLVSSNTSKYQVVNELEYSNISGPYNLPTDLKLPFNQNYISFSFNALDYSNPNSVVSRYILEGYDEDWSPITKERSTSNYIDLPPGDYTFKVASKGFNNVWSEPKEFSFTITPAWWKTWWAYLSYLIILLLVFYVIRNIYRSQMLKRENKVLEERVNLRTQQLEKSIEDLKATQSQLIQSEKMASLGELTAGIAHEIQNPLNFVNNFAEVNTELIEELKEERKKPDSERDLQLEDELLRDIASNEEKIKHHGKRADAIVKGMLQHSRNSSSDKELTDINKLADEYMRLSYHGLRARDKSFVAGMHMDFDESIPEIYVAPQDIGRVLLNLINNAYYAVNAKKKVAPDGYNPSVTVATRMVNDHIEIDVIDNGNGIPQEVIDKIFQPFFTTKPSGQGTGLGLSLSYDIIKAHGGTLTVRSSDGSPIDLGAIAKDELGNGTIFTISLPINE
ncbi:ATP-binding protein [Aegicerativicinus sediminis]|uniref:ATP-binding protein n=1 Tax=Aegicerativicinus sediminis TaxID=2893202 RepID=UPI001E405833|nr:ATP-binding protein [Aegicerativicinus sediminis]